MSALIKPVQLDPTVEYFTKAGNLDDIQIFNNQVLVAVYIRPEKTEGGLFTAEVSKTEDRYQSKVGLILKKGPSAFIDHNGVWFQGANIEVGDWVVYRQSDGWALELTDRDPVTKQIKKLLCRIMDDTAVRARISRPGRVW